MREVTVTEPGYAFIFLSNENLTQVDVHFDDVKITHTHSNIVAGADYYPFGLAMDGREIDDEPYRWGYQGQFSEKDSVTGWNEFDLRSYDARIARWLSPDPYGQFASPYLGMGNAPHMGVDPDGGFWGMGAVASGAVIGAAAGTVAGLIVDPDQFYLYSLAGAGLGALGGAIYNASTYDLTGIGRTAKNPSYPGSPNSTPSYELRLKGVKLPKPRPPKLGETIGVIASETLRVLYSYLTYEGNSQQPNTGTLTWTDVMTDGSRQNTGTYDANSGSRRLRPTPEADDWNLSNYRIRGEDVMTRNGVGFSVDITPDPLFGRSLLRIHPDGGVRGTAGCIGLTGTCDQLSDFSNRIENYLRVHRRMHLRVRGTYNPNSGGTQINIRR